jgi:hypothetical protein
VWSKKMAIKSRGWMTIIITTKINKRRRKSTREKHKILFTQFGGKS